MELNSKEELNLLSLKTLFKQKKKFVVLFVLFSLIIVIGISYMIPAEYNATATVMPPDDSDSKSGLSSLMQGIAGGSISIGGYGKSNKSELFTEFLTSRSVAEYIAVTCNLKNNKLYKFANDEQLYKAISSSLEVTYNRTGTITIVASAKTPAFPGKRDMDSAAVLSARIANAAIDGLDYMNKQKSTSKARRKLQFIKRVLADNKLKLDSIDNQMEDFQKKNKVLAIDEQTKAILGNAVNVGSELTKAEIELGIIMQDYTPDSKMVQTYKNRLAELQNQYGRTQRGGLTSTDDFSIPLTQVPELMKKYTNLLRDQKILTQVILYLETQKYQEAIQQESDVPMVEALDRAMPPNDKSSPNRKLMLILALFLSTIISCTIVTVRALMQRRLYLKRSDSN